MKIQLKKWNIVNLNFSLLDEKEKISKNHFSLESSNYFPEEEKNNTFSIGFKVSIKDKSLDLFIEALFDFELMDEKITKEFRLSSFPKVNAPAIAFPYLRAFISNLTLQAGIEPIILPSINFVNLANEEDESIKK